MKVEPTSRMSTSHLVKSIRSGFAFKKAISMGNANLYVAAWSRGCVVTVLDHILLYLRPVKMSYIMPTSDRPIDTDAFLAKYLSQKLEAEMMQPTPLWQLPLFTRGTRRTSHITVTPILAMASVSNDLWDVRTDFRCVFWRDIHENSFFSVRQHIQLREGAFFLARVLCSLLINICRRPKCCGRRQKTLNTLHSIGGTQLQFVRSKQMRLKNVMRCFLPNSENCSVNGRLAKVSNSISPFDFTKKKAMHCFYLLLLLLSYRSESNTRSVRLGGTRSCQH